MTERHHRAAWGAKAVLGSVATLVLLGIWGPRPALACRTPVYRYAMYNWPPVPYRVFYLYHGQPAEEDRAVNGGLSGLAAGDSAGANVTFHPVDVADEEQFEALPKVVQEAWLKQSEGAAAMHLVFTPWAGELFSGRPSSATIEAMVASPARTRLGEFLKEGRAAVLLILTGPNAEENQRAEKVVAQVAADVAAGKILAPPDADDDDMADQRGLDDPDGPRPEDDRNAPSRKLTVGIVKVSRNDPAEAWLVRCLMAIDPDLEEVANEPMVFAVFGRGRAMPPLVGKGIAADNLTECLDFLSGPCSCMVKDQNPGADLLMRWDWEATAEALASKDDNLRGGPMGYQEVGPGASHSSPAAPPHAVADEPRPKDTRPAEKAQQPPRAEAVGTPAPGSESMEAAQPGATSHEPEPDQAQGWWAGMRQSYQSRQAWMIGMGLVVGTILVMLIGVVVARRQTP